MVMISCFSFVCFLFVVVILFHVGFELIFLCDVMGRGEYLMSQGLKSSVCMMQVEAPVYRRTAGMSILQIKDSRGRYNSLLLLAK